AGTHGKTTTASMLAMILEHAGWRPSYLIGGTIAGLGPGASWQDGAWLVVEADESDGTFLELPAEAAIVTSVEPDHLEHFGGEAQLRSAFSAFVAGPTGPRLVCADEPGAAALAGATPGVDRYGTDPEADWRMVDVAVDGTGVSFGVETGGRRLGPARVSVPGLYNARNACAALAMATSIGVPFPVASDGLARFGGVGRLFEHRGERDGVTYIDDYGHLPGEVRAVLAAARTGAWSRVVAVFQPHRYSRTEALWASFADAFVDADVVVVTGIYASDESPRPGVSGQLVADAVRAAHPGQPVHYAEGRDELVTVLRSLLRPGDLCLTLGAGDLTALPDVMLQIPGVGG
ncbi:MAG: UDP-N-acetylmuramate--L-alanine ligase, partial [Acidimicrobiales bacterium]